MRETNVRPLCRDHRFYAQFSANKLCNSSSRFPLVFSAKSAVGLYVASFQIERLQILLVKCTAVYN